MNWLLSRKSIAATLVAAVLTVGLATTSADAQYRRYHRHHGPGPGVVAGLALGILGAGIIASQRDYYDDYPPVYYGAPYGYYGGPRYYYGPRYYRPYGYYRPHRYWRRPHGVYQRPYYGRRFVTSPNNMRWRR